MQEGSFKQRWEVFAESKMGKLVIRGAKVILTILIFAFLIYQLNKIGWKAIFNSLPTTPWFYLLFVIRYLALPISEQFIYRLSLDFSFWEGFKVFIKKKIFNSDLISYSGEAYLLAWGKNNLKVSGNYIFHVVKDNNIISSFASTLTAIVLLVSLVYFGQINFIEFIAINKPAMIGIISFVILILILAFSFRKKVVKFDTPTTLKIFSIHQLRLIIVYSLDILVCVVALPTVPLNVWFTFLAVQIIVTRIPFLPSQEILLLGIHAKITELYGVSQAEIMGVFVMITALGKVLNLIFYSFFSLNKTKTVSG